MRTFAPRVFGALLLLAASAASAAQRPARRAVDDWRQSVAHPEVFARLADGSPERAAADAVYARPFDGARAGLTGTSRSAPAAWSAPEVPPAAFTSVTAAPGRRPEPAPRRGPGPWTAALGIAALAAVALFSRDASRDPAPAPRPDPLPAPRAAPRVPEPTALERIEEYLARAPEPGPFVDARMPAPTWRAISRHEQALLDAWDRSPEKAAGRASFEEWLDARDATPGVDAVLLKAKLARA